jgi:hydrogenase maturation protease
MGMLRQPGHRFFFDPAEIEPLPGTDIQVRTDKPRILVAGIGNIFLGDDAFGVEVVRRLQSTGLPTSVQVKDFGIRGFDLAYALQDGYETVILVDAFPHGEPPGTVYVVEPDLDAAASGSNGAMVDAHSMNPVRVLQMASSMGTNLPQVLLVGCEPENLGGDEGHMGLSPTVEPAVDRAAIKVQSLVNQILEGVWPGSQ